MTAVDLHTLLTAPIPRDVRSCDLAPGLQPGDAAECGCIVTSGGLHLASGYVWLSEERLAAARYYGWREDARARVATFGRSGRVFYRVFREWKA